MGQKIFLLHGKWDQGGSKTWVVKIRLWSEIGLKMSSYDKTRANTRTKTCGQKWSQEVQGLHSLELKKCKNCPIGQHYAQMSDSVSLKEHTAGLD